ncbi:hypothetical protein ANCDUO_06671, partial [Ancylostoma duodenale]
MAAAPCRKILLQLQVQLLILETQQLEHKKNPQRTLQTLQQRTQAPQQILEVKAQVLQLNQLQAWTRLLERELLNNQRCLEQMACQLKAVTSQIPVLNQLRVLLKVLPWNRPVTCHPLLRVGWRKPRWRVLSQHREASRLQEVVM